MTKTSRRVTGKRKAMSKKREVKSKEPPGELLKSRPASCLQARSQLSGYLEWTTLHQENPMFKTITATYDSETTLKNVVDDLINDGLPREKVFSDDKLLQIKVIVPEASESGINEILKRHSPIKID